MKREKHTTKWKVNSSCKVQKGKPHDTKDKNRWAHNICGTVLNKNASTNIPFSPCLVKLNQKHRKDLYKQCMEEACG